MAPYDLLSAVKVPTLLPIHTMGQALASPKPSHGFQIGSSVLSQNLWKATQMIITLMFDECPPEKVATPKHRSLVGRSGGSLIVRSKCLVYIYAFPKKLRHTETSNLARLE